MAMRYLVKWLALGALITVIAACSSGGPRTGFAESDKFEPTSRFFLKGNTRLDKYVIRPASEGYDLVTPELFQHMIGNGLSHLELPGDFANYVLQGNIDKSLETFGRMAVNTLVGAGGLLDPAKEFGLPRQSTDFGITLGRYGVGEGSYLVLPLIGPTTMRDTAGFLVDRAFSPSTYVGQFLAWDAFGPATTGLGLLDGRNRNAEIINSVLYEADDPYVTLRSAYLQRRRAQIAGEDSTETIPDIFDDEETQ